MGVRATIWHDTFSLPLVSGVVEGKEFNLRRYLGGCFFVNSHGVVATCKHVVAGVPEDERLAVIHPNYPDKRSGVIDVKPHPRMDITFGHAADIKTSGFLKPYDDGENLLGRDVVCWGGEAIKHGDDIELVPRLLKGYVMRHWPQAPDWGALEALSVCELSFSIPEGYSGCPVLYQNERKRAVQLFGMAYGNLGSHITRHYEETVTEAGTTCVTTQDRIIEFGVAHTASDIQQAASDLGVTDLFE
jgi:hypothetical protein